MQIWQSLALEDYSTVFARMRDFTHARGPSTPDTLWLLQHHPVFTQGQAGKAEHILDPGPIPIIQSDRGGQVTYHGPGQLMIYTLIDLKRLQWGIKTFIQFLQQSILTLLEQYHIQGELLAHAPGVYVAGKKICSMGLRVRQGCTYHGLCLNVDLDLSPFARINPCGMRNLQVTQLKDYIPITLPTVMQDVLSILQQPLEQAQYEPSAKL